MMDLRSFILCLAAFSLALTGFVYGAKFIRKKNYLIGIEWFILATSSSNAVVYFATNSPLSFKIAHFFDTFSRAFGVPIVIPVGMMVLTHGMKPSIRFDIAIFALSFVATIAILSLGFFQPLLAYFLLGMSILYTIYLIYLVAILLKAGEKLQALGVALVTATTFFVAAVYDFYKIPGEDTNVIFNFFTIALFTWSYMTVQLYYAYCALERARRGGAAVGNSADLA
ncbi:hypothetical protein NED98_09055 [Sphingomonas sp. MMSM20]|uniref:hypothetical protein n=1 Tax=Sphingomonas lycopersici TaxID=2951807 RepID=UPI002237E64A|nr:hypothetical protein [Sphingomonas lycopersici]MCW6530392.1 hypothetical protein [Sphingomonas lycopersici]